MTTATTELEARVLVRRGVDLLDLRGPRDWRDRVDPDRLDVDSGWRCPLAQLYGTYWAGMKALELENGREYGFECLADGADGADGENSCDGALLTEIWRRELTGG